MSIILGSAYTATYTAVAPLSGSTATLMVVAPDQSTATPAVVVSGATATAVVPAVLVGSYLLVWSVVGTITDAQQDQFSVVAASLDLVDLADIRDELNISPSDTTRNAKLRRWAKSATTVVEKITGPILPRTRVDLFDGGLSFVVLPYRWVQSITSVVETRGVTNYTLTNQPLGASVNAFGYTWNPNTNKIIRRAMGAESIFPLGPSIVAVTYTLGMAAIPDDIQQGAAELIKHWYRKSEVPFRGAFSAAPQEESGLMVGNYFIPNGVMELLEPWRAFPGFF